MTEKNSAPDKLLLCSACGRKYNVQLPSCPFCGRERPTRENLTPHPDCPRCRVPMRRATLRGNLVQVCPSCRGLWLDLEEFDFLSSERDVYSDPSVPRKFEKPPYQPEREGSYLPCPICGDLMNRRNFKRVSGIVIDVCGRHGVWLDAGELARIRSFVANVDEHELLEKQAEFTTEELAALKRELKDVELVQQAVNFWNLKYHLYRNR